MTTVHKLWPTIVVEKDFDPAWCDKLIKETERYGVEEGMRFSLWAQDPVQFPETQVLRGHMMELVKDWVEAMGYPRDTSNPFFTMSWMYWIKPHQFAQPHAHKRDTLVVHFVADQFGPKQDLPHVYTAHYEPKPGGLYICDDGHQLLRPKGEYCAKMIECKKGRMTVFPISCLHGTHPMGINQQRLILATQVDFPYRFDPKEEDGQDYDHERDPRFTFKETQWHPKTKSCCASDASRGRRTPSSSPRHRSSRAT